MDSRPTGIDGLVVRSRDPLNAETAIPILEGTELTPNAHFYVRNHFPVPNLDPATWRLEVKGLVNRPLALSLADLLERPAQHVTATLECAGNGRSMLKPPVDGEQWGLGAVSTAEWTGVPLAEILDRAGVKQGARAAVFRSADGPFERSLTLDDLRSAAVLLAYAMNGEPLPKVHGFPLRVIVPGWYAVTAVKWLTSIEFTDHPFTGHFQTEKYVFERDDAGQVTKEPVRHLAVRALITRPGDGEVVGGEDLAVRGFAWSGVAPIARVDVSIDGGPWTAARLLAQGHQYGWWRWELVARAERRGWLTIRARATDEAGRSQPEQPPWNRLGYGNNAIQEIAVHVT